MKRWTHGVRVKPRHFPASCETRGAKTSLVGQVVSGDENKKKVRQRCRSEERQAE